MDLIAGLSSATHTGLDFFLGLSLERLGQWAEAARRTSSLN